MTNKEVAQLAGVSSAAVSRYLNGGYLSAEKRERIAAAIEETGYVPSANARILRTKKSDTVGVVFTRTDDSAMTGIVSGLEKYFFAGDYGTSLAYADDDVREQSKIMRSMLERQIDGIILVSSAPVPGDLELYERARVPVVIVGQHVRNISCIRFDNFGLYAGKPCGLHRCRGVVSLERRPSQRLFGRPGAQRHRPRCRGDPRRHPLCGGWVSSSERLAREKR